MHSGDVACRFVKLWLCALLWTAGQATANELTLEAAIAKAHAQAPQLQAQGAALEAAQARAVAAGRLPDPELMTGVDDLPVTTRDAGSLMRDEMTMRRIGVMQSFPARSKRSADRQIALAAIGMAQAEQSRTALEVARATAEAWIDVHTAQQLQANLEALRPELELQARAVQARLRSARASTADALAAQGALLELEDRLLEARREVQAARARLARWMGAEALTAVLADAPSFEQLPAAPETLRANLHKHGPLLAFDAHLAMARGEVERAKADKSPDWSAQVSYGRRAGDLSDMLTVEFRVGLPLFSATRQDPLLRAKRAELARVELERAAQLRMHEAELSAALAGWNSARARLDLYRQQRVPLARERTQAAFASYQAGGTALADLMASVVAEIELQRGQTEVRRELGRQWVFLRYLDPETGP
jgi:outer membrane protein, heavy metal efflux system